MNLVKVRKDLQQFFLEDIGDIDLTSELIFDESIKTKGYFVLKESGVFSGKTIIKEGYKLLDPEVNITFLVEEGELLESGTVIAEIEGKVSTLLTGERVILNLVQKMSGIATQTRRAVDSLQGSSIKVCDTRKTTPGLRVYEKYAVRCGGGYNHRFGLDYGVMLKDNHISACGSIATAIQHFRSRLGPMTKIEVETESEQQVREAVKAGADIIMFDNCTPKKAKQLRGFVPSSILVEVSGGITLETLSSYRDTGVDFISLGCLTHSAKGLDISFLVEGEKYESTRNARPTSVTT